MPNIRYQKGLTWAKHKSLVHLRGIKGHNSMKFSPTLERNKADGPENLDYIKRWSDAQVHVQFLGVMCDIYPGKTWAAGRSAKRESVETCFLERPPMLATHPKPLGNSPCLEIGRSRSQGQQVQHSFLLSKISTIHLHIPKNSGCTRLARSFGVRKQGAPPMNLRVHGPEVIALEILGHDSP